MVATSCLRIHASASDSADKQAAMSQILHKIKSENPSPCQAIASTDSEYSGKPWCGMAYKSTLTAIHTRIVQADIRHGFISGPIQAQSDRMMPWSIKERLRKQPLFQSESAAAQTGNG